MHAREPWQGWSVVGHGAAAEARADGGGGRAELVYSNHCVRVSQAEPQFPMFADFCEGCNTLDL